MSHAWLKLEIILRSFIDMARGRTSRAYPNGCYGAFTFMSYVARFFEFVLTYPDPASTGRVLHPSSFIHFYESTLVLPVLKPRLECSIIPAPLHK